MPNTKFKFEISLSVLNHLGRNLYRNFITILGEAVSNSWDANANNVWIDVDTVNNHLVIKDDGDGMDSRDFKLKFLKVGYSKRKEFGMLSAVKKRPYIGAKGIGKLALLSCAEIVSVISKKETTSYTGGVIDNSELTNAIKRDLKPDKYSLKDIDMSLFTSYIKDHKKGTIIRFDSLKEDLRGTVPHLKKLIALQFRFSLVDPTFSIFMNGEKVTLDDLKELSNETEFLWVINDLEDPYLTTLSKLKKERVSVQSSLKIRGFIATVVKPRYLKVSGSEEKTGIDLFVNGRLREKDILKHLPDFSTRHIANYLYGQIHYDELDSTLDNDRFGTSRESIVPGDEKFKEVINLLRGKLLRDLSNDWDKFRLESGEDGDIEIVTKQRKAVSLFNVSVKDYQIAKSSKADLWVKELRPDAEFNIPSYVDCFLSENLIRKYIRDQNIQLTDPAKDEIKEWKDREKLRMQEANISFKIRQNDDELDYLGMDFLAKVVEGSQQGTPTASLVRDATEFKPMRNAVGHTAQLSLLAQQKLTLVYENIKARIKNLLPR